MSFNDDDGIDDVDLFHNFTLNESQIWLKPSELPYDMAASGLPFSLTQPFNDADSGNSVDFVIESSIKKPVRSPTPPPENNSNSSVFSPVILSPGRSLALLP